MDYNADNVMPANFTIDFFNEHAMETIATCMQIQPSTDAVSDKQADDVKFKAMDVVTKKYEFGNYKYLYKDPESCNANLMFSKNEGNFNVWFCLGYSGNYLLKP